MSIHKITIKHPFTYFINQLTTHFFIYLLEKQKFKKAAKIFQIIIKSEESFNQVLKIYLLKCITNNNVAALEFFIENNIEKIHIDFKKNILIQSVECNNLLLSKHLVKDVNGKVSYQILCVVIGYNNFIKNSTMDWVNEEYVKQAGIEEINKQFLRAASFNELAILKEILKKGADINYANGEPLFRAARKEHYDIVEYLLINNAETTSVQNSLDLSLEMFDYINSFKAKLKFHESISKQLLIKNESSLEIKSKI